MGAHRAPRTAVPGIRVRAPAGPPAGDCPRAGRTETAERACAVSDRAPAGEPDVSNAWVRALGPGPGGGADQDAQVSASRLLPASANVTASGPDDSWIVPVRRRLPRAIGDQSVEGGRMIDPAAPDAASGGSRASGRVRVEDTAGLGDGDIVAIDGKAPREVGALQRASGWMISTRGCWPGLATRCSRTPSLMTGGVRSCPRRRDILARHCPGPSARCGPDVHHGHGRHVRRGRIASDSGRRRSLRANR